MLIALASALGPVWTEATMLAWQRLYRLTAERCWRFVARAFAGPAACVNQSTGPPVWGS